MNIKTSRSIDAFHTGSGSVLERDGRVRLIQRWAYSTTTSLLSSPVFLARHIPAQRAPVSLDCMRDRILVHHLFSKAGVIGATWDTPPAFDEDAVASLEKCTGDKTDRIEGRYRTARASDDNCSWSKFSTGFSCCIDL